MGRSPVRPGLPGSVQRCLRRGRLAEGVLVARCLQQGSALLGYRVNHAPSVSAPSGGWPACQGAGCRTRGSGPSASSPRRCRSYWPGQRWSSEPRQPWDHLGAAWAGPGPGQAEAAVTSWLQVSRPLAAGPHVPLFLLSGLANHGQTRHMVRGRAVTRRARQDPYPCTCAHTPFACTQLPRQSGRRPRWPGPRASCWVSGAACSPRGVPLMPPPAAGTKPKPPAQREVLPHQSAPDPGGLPAPRQAAEDELDRRPR